MIALMSKRWLRRLTAPTQSTFVQVPRALVVSVAAATLDVALLLILVEAFGWPSLVAASLAYAAGGVVQYILSAWWVFSRSPDRLAHGVALFVLLSAVGLAITCSTIYALEGIGVAYAAAKLVALGLAFVWNFSSRKCLVFRTA